MWKKIWNPSNRKVLILNIVSAFALTLFLEWMERKSSAELNLFIQQRTFVFLYNVLIIFMTLSLVFLVKKKYFTFGLICAAWGLVGLVNGLILNSRKTPFTAVDLTIAKSIIPIITSYFAIWQIVFMVIALILGIAGLVTLYLYCPSAKKAFDFKSNFFMIVVFLGFFSLATYLGVGRGLLISRFDNPISGYQDYGVAYGFCITAIDTGIDRPIDYSRYRVKKVKKIMKDRVEEESKGKKTRKPNIIFIQLESFFDITDVKGLQFSEDPLPNFHRLQGETTSGYVKVPVYGAGTINTEFEMITGMNLEFFGTGEYPYRSILHKTTCESMAYWMKENGYKASVIHNNNASFYDRDFVFSNLGFDTFITSENMDIYAYNKAGWACDEILEDYIFEVMNTTKETDYIYGISVQGHGDYPSDEVIDAKITVDGKDWDEKYRNMVTYYTNEIHDMDRFLGSLVDRLSQYGPDTVLVVYGDHLPSLDFESKQLKTKSKYKTPYLIWDNFGYNARHKDLLSGDLKAYQMPSKVLKELGICNGVMNAYHQVMGESGNYKKNMRLLQYDMLYGSSFAREGKEPLERSDIKYCVKDVKINKLKKSDDYIYIMGENFTKYSRVYVNGVPNATTKVGRYVLRIPMYNYNEDDEIVIHQVSKTNENITLNVSNTFKVKEKQILPEEIYE
ncbi:MAG: sulfatase-like hydrolase/transferase [Eubacteriales bacterium]|nr:sulfatase-like hydrolase/transferase [Eubacteriales bacterium]